MTTHTSKYGNIRSQNELEAQDTADGENQSLSFRMGLLRKPLVGITLTLPICISSQLAILTRAPSQIPTPTEARLEVAWLVCVSASPMLNRPTMICTAYDGVHRVDSHFNNKIANKDISLTPRVKIVVVGADSSSNKRHTGLLQQMAWRMRRNGRNTTSVATMIDNSHICSVKIDC